MRLLIVEDEQGLAEAVQIGLVREGYAQPLTVPPNVRFEDRFARLARDARRAGRGLWASCSS